MSDKVLAEIKAKLDDIEGVLLSIEEAIIRVAKALERRQMRYE